MGRTFPPLADEIRQNIKDRSKADDIVAIVAWLLTHYTDEGRLRTPQGARRKTIAIDDITYWLVKKPS